jgi:hypothetical protein
VPGETRLIGQARDFKVRSDGVRTAKCANSFSDVGNLTEDDLARKYKVILSNPPFAGTLPKDSIRKDLPTNSKKSELLFLGVMMEALPAVFDPPAGYWLAGRVPPDEVPLSTLCAD